MDQKQRKQFREAVQDVARILQFESWLRFYFLQEEGSAFVMRIPEMSLERIRQAYEDLAGLAEMVNGQEMDYEKSFATVCEFVASRLDGQRYEPGVCTNVFDSQPFMLEMQLFNLWLQAHESQLEDAFFDFEAWQGMYREWKGSAEVKKYLEENREELLMPGRPKGSPIQ